MDVTGLKNDTVTGSDSTFERSYCQETGNYKYLTVRPAEDKEVLFHAGNFASDNTGTFGTNLPCSNSLFTFNDCKVSHSRPCSPKSIESKKSVEGHQKEAFNSDQVQVRQTKLLAMLTSGEVEKHYVKEELEKLVQRFDELHVNVSLMDKVNKLKREIEQYIDPHRLVGEEYSSKNGAPSRKTIAGDIQIIAREIAIWAGTTTNNLKVLTYIIEQGFPIKQSADWFDHDPESIAYLPFDTMTTLIDNCSPYCPDLLFVKAIFADADPRFDVLAQTILTSRRISDGLYQEAIAQSIPTASQSRLKVFFNYLRSQANASNMIKDLVKQSFEHHRIANLAGIHRYKNSVIMVFVLEAIAQQSQGEARTLIRSFCQDEQQLIAMTALLGGLHQSSELLNEMGITVTRQAFKEVSVNLKNSAFFMAKEAGLTNERLFTNTVNRIAPFLWTLANKYEHHLHQRSLFPDKKVQSFIHLVMKQAAIYQKESQESKQWPGPNCVKELVLGDVSLWAAKIFSVTDDAVSADSLGLGLLQEDARYSETWNILINKAKSCNGLTRPDDFMKFMDWLLIEGLYLVRMESEYREKEATFTARQKSYRPDLWPDPHSKVSTTSSASHDQLVSYTKLVTTLHFDIIESFLRLAPSGHRIHVLNNWLTNPDCTKQRKTLFRQPVYPLNNMECPNIWQLLLSLDKDYQPPENQFDHDWQIPVNPQQWTAPPPLASLSSESVEVYGRTLAIQRTDGGWDYLKFISDKEKPEDLATEGNKIRLMADIASRYGLKSSIPQVVGSYRWDNANIDLATFTPPAKKARLEEKCRYIDGKTGYCLHLKSTKDAPYHLYPYDLDPVTKADQICQGLHKYAHDSGVLFSCGLYAPAVIAADHDSVTKRKHHVLSSYVGATSEGRMLQWKKASEHPNVGPVGMRDSGDTKSMIELGEDYFFSKRYQEFLDFEKSEDRAKVAFSELAKNAQGLILQYALCFQKQFNPDNRESTLHHERKIQDILTTLFHKAFPRFTEERVVQAMDEDELLSQAVREVIYWCGHGARFVNDIKQNIIPESTYPGCSEATNIVDFSTLEPRELIPGIGFVTRDNQPNLGVTFGINPLVTLNALIVKLLALGALTSL